MNDQSSLIFLLCIYVTFVAARCYAAFFNHESRAMTWINALSHAPVV
jgi:hypothetical protein